MNVLPSEWFSELKDAINSVDDVEIIGNPENTKFTVSGKKVDTRAFMDQVSEDIVNNTKLIYDSDSVTVKYILESKRVGRITSDKIKSFVSEPIISRVLSEDVPAVLGVEVEYEIAECISVTSPKKIPMEIKEVLEMAFSPSVVLTNFTEKDNKYVFEYQYQYTVPYRDKTLSLVNEMSLGRVINIGRSIDLECSKCGNLSIDTENEDGGRVWSCSNCGYSSVIDGEEIAEISGDSPRSEIKKELQNLV